MAARTPGLDWVRALYVQHSGGYEKHGQDMIVEEGTGRTIAVVYDGAFYSERIVEACNSHDSLVSRLKGQCAELDETAAQVVTLRSQRDALREALMDIVDIASHRWRALPQGTPEKDRLAKSRAALAIADGAR